MEINEKFIEILNRLIEVQTKRNEIDLNNQKRIEKIENEKVLREKRYRKRIIESFNRLINLDKNIIIDFLSNLKYEKTIGHRIPPELELFLLEDYSIDIKILSDILMLKIPFDDYELRKIFLKFELYANQINEIIEGKKEDDKIPKIEWLSDRIYLKSKGEKLPTINKKEVLRIAMDLGIYKEVKKDIIIISEIVRKKLLNDIKNDGKYIREHISKEVKEKILERDRNKCRLCDATDYLEISHKIPVSKGGSNEYENLIVLCRKCNSKIGSKIIK